MEKTEHFMQAKTYTINKFHDEDDIEEELTRVRYLKKLFSRMKSGKANYRLILNHMTILFNVFEYPFVIHLLKSSFKEEEWYKVNTVLVYLRRSLDLINIDHQLLKELEEKV